MERRRMNDDRRQRLVDKAVRAFRDVPTSVQIEMMSNAPDVYWPLARLVAMDLVEEEIALAMKRRKQRSS
jgi:hypothetical protein